MPIAEAVLTCTHNLCFEQILNKKNNKYFLLKIFKFCNLKDLCILHGRVFIMYIRQERKDNSYYRHNGKYKLASLKRNQ